jgi:hypothetical protein
MTLILSYLSFLSDWFIISFIDYKEARTQAAFGFAAMQGKAAALRPRRY